MKILITSFYVAFGLWVGNPGSIANAQPKLISDAAPQCVFSGKSRNIVVVWHNPTDAIVGAEINARILQTSSATAVRLSEAPWKNLQVLPQQTVLESARLDFPPVRAKTTFLVQWVQNSNNILGKTEVLVYPTNLLVELKSLMGENILGVLDPNNVLKPLLMQSGADFVDLGETPLDDFRGKLAIIGPFQSKIQMREGLPQAVQQIARKGVAAVWIQPRPAPTDKIEPSFYFVPQGKGAILVVQADLVANLAENPRAQLNLIFLSKLALHPELFPLPDLKGQL